MSGGNGIDIAAVYQLLTRVAETQGEHTRTLDEHTRTLDAHGRVLDAHTRILEGHSNILDAQARVLNELSTTVNQHTRILADHTRQLTDLAHGQVTLRQTLTEYPSSVIGHGILFSQLEDRVRRIEQHLNLSPAA